MTSAKALFDASLIPGKPVYISYFFISKKKKVVYETSYPLYSIETVTKEEIDRAEMQAFYELLKAAKERNIKKINIYGDNKNVIDKINNKIINEETMPIFELMDQFEKIKLRWVNRDGNMYADFLCKLGRYYGKYENDEHQDIKYKMSNYKNLI